VKRGRGLRLVGAGLLAPLVLLVWAAVGVYRPLAPGFRPTRLVVVAPGMTADAVASLLQADGLIRRGAWFTLAARLWHDTGRLKAGTYRFGRGMSVAAMLHDLVAGRVAVARVVIPEGWTVPQIISALAAHGLGSPRALTAAARSPQFLAAAHLPRPAAGARFALEGYLFPATYRFPLGATPTTIMATMVARFQQAWTPALAAEARRSGLDTREAVTLASIVQSEVRTPAEMAVVAAVYLNRLRRGMALDADPTVLYGLGLLGVQTTPLSGAELASPSPYNTYTHRGWPPGPICNPGLAALEAVASPARVSALYFLTTRGGRLVLARTLAQQVANARRAGLD
jgi:UPF0755 protein